MSGSGHAPSVSVVIPAFNAAEFLAQAVASARRQLPAPAEIIVVDDGSTDHTASLVSSLGPGVRYLRQDNRGPAAARNAGVAIAGGEALAFLDADDWWPDDALGQLTGPIVADEALDAVIGQTQVMESVGDQHGTAATTPAGRAGLITVLGSALFRRRVLERVGPFDERLPYGEEDVDWFLRAREAGIRIATISTVTLYYRRHGRNLTQSAQAGSQRLLTSLRRSLARRRDAGQDAGAFPLWSPAGGTRPAGSPPDA
jgi:glycosyltransferase involved in cell wall biosynthesis